ncbi:MAG TPA: hypothetical protein VHC49_16205 [Mycobacteriales bacterium]|nr:hypothetical protein [Mycobacteriales bacterium]
MPERIPISVIIDDGCPIVHLYRYHLPDAHDEEPLTGDGARLVDEIPGSFLDEFCAVTERHGISGKFSIVPMPAGLGDVARGIDGHPAEETRTWIDTARTRLGPRFDFCPEMLTHDFAVNLDDGSMRPETELDWSREQDVRALTPYLTKALQLLKDAGVEATGVTSPWTFADQVEAEYQQAIIAAQQAVWGRRLSWYFLHAFSDRPSARPYIARVESAGALVSIVANIDDYFWASLYRSQGDPDAIAVEIADHYLTDDGRDGDILRVLDSGGWPTIVTHWQCLYGNGSQAGLRALDLLGERINRLIGDRVQWSTCSDLVERTVTELRGTV